MSDAFSADTIPLPRDSGQALRFGRDSANEVVLSGKAISRFHAEIVLKDGTYYLKDMGSHNGTFLNNNPVQSAALKSGDVIQVGRASFTVGAGVLHRLTTEGVLPGEVGPDNEDPPTFHLKISPRVVLEGSDAGLQPPPQLPQKSASSLLLAGAAALVMAALAWGIYCMAFR